MELRSVQAFVILAETLHFHRAAARLGLSQPSLSVRIRRLEDRLGFVLFERSSTGVRLTGKGAAFLAQARDLVARWDGLRAGAARIASGTFERLRFGVTPIGLFSRVPEILRRWSREHPGTRIDLTDADSDTLEARVEDQTIDIAFVHPPCTQPALAGRALFTEPFAAVLPDDHALATAAAVDLAQLAGENFIIVRREVGPAIHDRIIAACVAAGFSPRITHEVATSLATIGLVAAGGGVGLVIRSLAQVARPGIVVVPLREALELPFALCWRPGAHDVIAAQLLIAAAEPPT